MLELLAKQVQAYLDALDCARRTISTEWQQILSAEAIVLEKRLGATCHAILNPPPPPDFSENR